MSNGSVAPVCPVSRSQVPAAQPQGRVAIVPITDLSSAIVALQQIALILPTLPTNNLVPPAVPPIVGPPPSGKSKPGWRELDRATETVYIKNPDDDSVSVPLTRISFLLFEEHQTHIKLIWEL